MELERTKTEMRECFLECQSREEKKYQKLKSLKTFEREFGKIPPTP